MELEDLLAEADAQLAAVEPITVPATLATETVGVRFLPMSGANWRTLVLKHPPRPDAPQDLQMGYNIDAVVAAYPDVALILGDRVDDMWRDTDEGRVWMWPKTWERISATGRKDISTEMWAAHEYLPEQLVSNAGKA
ncbi:hypothetical protein [Microbacterium paludicola]|uniref:hypothetical protein n=1 Tax=Microbacterium paludicola TaxID=300019 RepID=UPI0011A43859|nr:hypothetical protein [Microbacterium paludicola]